MNEKKIAAAVKQYWKADVSPLEREQQKLIALTRDLNDSEFNEYVKRTSPEVESTILAQYTEGAE